MIFDEVIETNNKKISIQINNRGEVILKKPKRYKKELLDNFIKSKESWIIEHKAKILETYSKYEKVFNYKTILINGEEKALNIPAKTNSITVNNVNAKTQGTLITLLKNNALKSIEEKVNVISKKMGVKPENIFIENAKRRWGVCTSKKEIKINFRAFMLNEELFTYIIVHELAHLKEFNHSKKFWSIVAKNCPKYQKYKKQLKEFSFLLELYR